MPLTPTLFFAGNAQDALDHYHTALGGDVDVMRFSGSPAASTDLPADWGDKVLYGTLRSAFGGLDVMDAPPGREGPPGENFAIALRVENEVRGAQLFAALAEGGSVLMPFEPTFFAKTFGMVADRFGVRWMITVDGPVASQSKGP